jgi:5'-nucleotidase
LRLLLTNDDGVMAPGIQILARILGDSGHDVIIVAPDQERSGTSHSITLRKPLVAEKIGTKIYAVSGTPADCMIIASQVIIKDGVDLVLSGINAGQNMGEDVLYSGTVAAAIEAMFMGFKAISVSINGAPPHNYETAAHFIDLMIKSEFHLLIHEHEIVNINIPNVPISEIKGFRITKTGHRKYENFVRIESVEDDKITYRVGGDKPIWNIEKGTDAEAVQENYISLTPIGFNFTKGDSFPKILEWIEEKETNIITEIMPKG